MLPELPEEITAATADIYRECYRKITGRQDY